MIDIKYYDTVPALSPSGIRAWATKIAHDALMAEKDKALNNLNAMFKQKMIKLKTQNTPSATMATYATSFRAALTALSSAMDASYAFYCCILANCPDGKTPTVDSVCLNPLAKGLTGAAYNLAAAYCE